MNAAKFVKNFLLTANEEQNVTFSIADVSGAMSVVEQTIRVMAEAGNEDAQLASTCLESIWLDIWAAYERGGKSREMHRSNVSLSIQDRMALRTAERLLDQGPEQYTSTPRRYPFDDRRAAIVAERHHTPARAQGIHRPPCTRSSNSVGRVRPDRRFQARYRVR